MEADVMVVGAHPDDAELGMGGTIAALVKEGARVVLVDLTDGEPTPRGTREIRMKEAQRAAEILGVAERVLLDISNREVSDTPANRKKLATVFRKHRPRVVFAHYWEDAHPDHVAASALTLAARFYAKFVKTDMPFEPHYPARVFHYLANHMRVPVKPAFVFDTTAFFETKIEAIRAYGSQFVEFQENNFVFDRIRDQDRYWGSQIYRANGEAFVSQEALRVSSLQGVLEL